MIHESYATLVLGFLQSPMSTVHHCLPWEHTLSASIRLSMWVYCWPLVSGELLQIRGCFWAEPDPPCATPTAEFVHSSMLPHRSTC